MSRTPDPGFDHRIADWLEADPNTAPRDLMTVVESALPSIPQRRAWRLPWRSQPMNRFAILAATVALAAVAGLGIMAVGSQPSTPPRRSNHGAEHRARPAAQPVADRRCPGAGRLPRVRALRQGA